MSVAFEALDGRVSDKELAGTSDLLDWLKLWDIMGFNVQGMAVIR